MWAFWILLYKIIQDHQDHYRNIWWNMVFCQMILQIGVRRIHVSPSHRSTQIASAGTGLWQCGNQQLKSSMNKPPKWKFVELNIYCYIHIYIYIYQHLAGGLNQGLRGPGSRNKEGQWCYVLCSFMSEHQECTVIVYPSMVAASTQLRFSQSIPEWKQKKLLCSGKRSPNPPNWKERIYRLFRWHDAFLQGCKIVGTWALRTMPTARPGA